MFSGVADTALSLSSNRRIIIISQVPWFSSVYAPTAKDPFCVYTIVQEPFL